MSQDVHASLSITCRSYGVNGIASAGQRWEQIVQPVKTGNPNVRHYELILDAEWAALTGQNDVSEKKYQAAVISAARGGYLHDACLASERLGNFELNIIKDKEEATYRLKEAMKYAEAWGGHGVVDSIKQRYSQLFPK